MLRPLLAFFVFLLLSHFPLSAQTKLPELPSRETLAVRANSAAGVLNKLYWSPTLSIWLDRTGDDLRGHFDGRINPPWWSAANVVETLIDLMNATGSTEYQPALESLYETHRDLQNKLPRLVAELKKRSQWTDADDRKLERRQAAVAQRKPTDPKAVYGTEFRNEYLDDSAWWGIAWLKMFDRTKAPKYLATARAIHVHLARNWRPDKGGGIMWCEDPDKLHPNAITNSLFIILSARLYERTHEAPYLEWAEKTLAWFREKALYDGTAVVDQPGHQGDYWTYNQGAYLGALVALHRATGKAEYLDQAIHAAETILGKSGLVLPSGVIVEKLGTSGWDPGLFKGVFVRYLAELRDHLAAQKRHADLAQKIDTILRASTASLLTHASTADGQYRISWEENAKDQTRNFNTQAAALALLTAALGTSNP